MALAKEWTMACREFFTRPATRFVLSHSRSSLTSSATPLVTRRGKEETIKTNQHKLNEKHLLISRRSTQRKYFSCEDRDSQAPLEEEIFSKIPPLAFALFLLLHLNALELWFQTLDANVFKSTRSAMLVVVVLQFAGWIQSKHFTLTARRCSMFLFSGELKLTSFDVNRYKIVIQIHAFVSLLCHGCAVKISGRV